MRVRWLAWGCVLALLAGCECGGRSSESAPPPSTSPVDPPSAPTSDGVAISSVPEQRTEENRAAMRTKRRAFTRALREARRAAREGDHATALARMDEALAALPEPRARCEAGYIAFRAGDHARARSMIETALRELPRDADVPERLRAPLAMCLYNAGLVRRELGDATGARDAFTRSLALRAHPSVERALAELGEAPADAPAPAVPSAPTSPIADDALESLVDEEHAVFRATLRERACEDLEELPAALVHGDVRAMLIEPCREPEGSGELWVAHDGRVDVVPLYEIERPSAEVGASRSGTARAQWLDVIAGGRAELVVGFEQHGELYVPFDEGEESSTSITATTMVCAIEPALRCAAWRTFESERSLSLGAEDDDGGPVAGEARDEIVAGSFVLDASGSLEVGAPLCARAREEGQFEDAYDYGASGSEGDRCEPDASALRPGVYAVAQLLGDPRVCRVGCAGGARATASTVTTTPTCRRVPDAAGVPAGRVLPDREWFAGTMCGPDAICDALIYERGDGHWLVEPFEIERDDDVETWLALCSLGSTLGPEPFPQIDSWSLREAARVQPDGRAPIVARWLDAELEPIDLYAQQALRTRMLIVVDVARGTLERVLAEHEDAGPYCWRGMCPEQPAHLTRLALDRIAEEEQQAEADDVAFDDRGTGSRSYVARRTVEASADPREGTLKVRIGPWSTARETSVEGAEERSTTLDLAPLRELAEPGPGERTHR
ncbi:tetratricopeptide repeat protein [Sandaracinus amylolyticus]|uniref:tetratricopeptide repeat protein n=1 Tax=Sandaracinus amylolyticus TaxID=927083 RepID=UPI0012EE9107|nr:tetratricopeptide repeat protein [Sandaracinus amylolyticus]